MTGIKHDFDAALPLCEDLCELTGAIIGDGHLCDCSRTFLIEITGDRELDELYHCEVLAPIAEKLFGVKVFYRVVPGGRRLRIYSKRFRDLFVVRFGIPSGRKSSSVSIPSEIMESDLSHICSTLRGLFDTDGGVGFDKRPTYSKPYVRINYVSCSLTLVQQISFFLAYFNIKHSIHLRRYTSLQYQIQINGEKEVKKFLRYISFSNPRHLVKVRHLISDS